MSIGIESNLGSIREGGEDNEHLIRQVALALGAIDVVRPELGWSCVVIGSDPSADVLARVSLQAGARSVQLISAPQFTDSQMLGQKGPGETIVFIFDADSATIDHILGLIPDRSRVVLVGSMPTSPIMVNFYEGVHRKSIDLVGHAPSISVDIERRASLLVASRGVLGSSEPL